MRRWLTGLFCFIQLLGFCQSPQAEGTNNVSTPITTNGAARVYIIPIRDDIMPPLVYIVRRGVKEAIEAKADVLILDMETNGGRVDTTEKIIGIIDQFQGKTITYVNKKAFSAGAFISFATQKIYMAPQSVIGAAAPIMVSPTGSGTEAMPDTMEIKMTSALSALVRANAEKNGHNPDVADAMVKKTKELEIDGKIINPSGQILTLTDREAGQKYGEPAKPLLSAGTVGSMDDLLKELGIAGAAITRIEPTGAEKTGTWINAISPILLVIGIIAFYLEFKTPGFGIFGITGIVAFAIYFLGGYIAGMSGAEWILVFAVGVVLVILEFFVLPGTVFLGIAGVGLMLFAIIMALVDLYPGRPVFPLPAPSLDSLNDSLQVFTLSIVISIGLAVILARLLPKTPIYATLVSEATSGNLAVRDQEQQRAARLGQVGVAISALRPGGKARFGDQIIDVMTQGDMVSKGETVKIVGFSGPEAVVEPVKNA